MANISSVSHTHQFSLLGYYLFQFWDDLQDPRTKYFFLSGGLPYPVLAIMGFFLYFALSLGPKIMKDRPPLDALKPLITVYNFAMASSNAYFVSLLLYHCEYGRRFFIWEYPDRADTSPQTLWELRMAWWYWMTKFLDLLDTVFFVLRKKYNHLSFLHLYHHTVVPLFGYICLKSSGNAPGMTLFGLLNGIVHISMYTYFGLSSLGPQMQPYLWWKRYLTQLQLGQFILFGLYAVVLFFKQTGYPPIVFWIGMTQPPVFFYLFYSFYRKTYNSNSSNKSKEKVHQPQQQQVKKLE